MIEDIVLMKQANINAVRIRIIPMILAGMNVRPLWPVCQDEADIETHGVRGQRQ